MNTKTRHLPKGGSADLHASHSVPALCFLYVVAERTLDVPNATKYLFKWSEMKHIRSGVREYPAMEWWRP